MALSLTQSHRDILAVHEKKWVDIALSVTPIDRSAATEAVEAAYRGVGLDAPKVVFVDHWVANRMYHNWYSAQAQQNGDRDIKTPIKGGLSMIALFEKQSFKVENQYFFNLDAVARDTFRSVDIFFDQNVTKPLYGMGVALSSNSEHAKMIDGQATNATLMAVVHEYGTLAKLSFARDHLGLKKETKAARHLIDCATLFTHWIPLMETVLIFERPKSFSFDQQGRPSNMLGSAITLHDGQKFYFEDGVRLKVPPPEHVYRLRERIMNQEELTLDELAEVLEYSQR